MNERLEGILTKTCEQLPFDWTWFEKEGLCKKTPDNCKYYRKNADIHFCNKKTYTSDIIKIHRKLLPASLDAGLTEFSFESGFLGCQKCSSLY